MTLLSYALLALGTAMVVGAVVFLMVQVEREAPAEFDSQGLDRLPE